MAQLSAGLAAAPCAAQRGARHALPEARRRWSVADLVGGGGVDAAGGDRAGRHLSQRDGELLREAMAGGVQMFRARGKAMTLK